MVANFILIFFLLFGFSFANDNCVVISDIVDECVNNLNYSCEEKEIMLSYSLKKQDIDNETIKIIVKLCGYYCKLPFEWQKDKFIDKCKKGKDPLLQ